MWCCSLEGMLLNDAKCPLSRHCATPMSKCSQNAIHLSYLLGSRKKVQMNARYDCPIQPTSLPSEMFVHNASPDAQVFPKLPFPDPSTRMCFAATPVWVCTTRWKNERRRNYHRTGMIVRGCSLLCPSHIEGVSNLLVAGFHQARTSTTTKACLPSTSTRPETYMQPRGGKGGGMRKRCERVFLAAAQGPSKCPFISS